MLLSWTAIIFGLALLVWSADRFVIGASVTARNLGVSPMIIGMMVLGFGTSAPEMFVGGVAAWSGSPEIAVGNALGSNIANIALVLGIAALITPLTVESQTLRREFPALLLICITVYLLFYDGTLSRWDGILLLLGTLAMMLWLYWLSTRPQDPDDPLESEISSELPDEMTTAKSLFWIVIGLVLLVSSSHMLVWGAINVAHEFGISDLLIGLTIVAVGTSLPEVAVSISAALKKEHDIVIGNVIGSNMFNLLAVLGISSSIQATELSPLVLGRDYPIMLGLTIALFFMAYGFKGKGRINRIEASILLLSYCSYMIVLYFTELAPAQAALTQ